MLTFKTSQIEDCAVGVVGLKRPITLTRWGLQPLAGQIPCSIPENWLNKTLVLFNLNMISDTGEASCGNANDETLKGTFPPQGGFLNLHQVTKQEFA